MMQRWSRKDPKVDIAERMAEAQRVFDVGDHAAAISIWLPLAHAGFARAQNNIGACLINSLGVERDQATGIKWLQVAAGNGDRVAQRNLAAAYFKGEGVEPNELEAGRLYRLAAEQGDAEAQEMLSWMLADSENLAHDYEEAMIWAKAAAEQGVASAMTRIGMLYHNALGVARDPQLAAEWWLKGSRKSDGNSQAMLGAAYQLGAGVPRDMVQSLAWLIRAKKSGSLLAENYYNSARRSMEPSDIAARREARNGTADVIVGTAGHIDHGKSSLVRALTGTDPDRLKEEKQRGITIDLGYAYWPRPCGDIVGFVDVPGHEALIHNMLAGATGIDFVLLTVAADDGVMPQTREHLAILNLLGLGRGIVTLTKSDLADEDRRREVSLEIRSLLAGTAFADAAIIPVSAQTGEGLQRLIGALDQARASLAVRSAANRFRLDIDRVFNLPGAGTVVTGTVVSGMVRVGDRLVVSPAGLEARVRSIHAQNRDSKEGYAGQRCALAIAGPDISKSSVSRGQCLVDPILHAPTSRIDVTVQLLASERKPLGQWQPVRFHHGAAEAGAHVVTLSDQPWAPGQSGFAQLVLDAPITAMAGDRFILRDWSASRTIGGGIIHDLRAPERKRRTPARRAELGALALEDTAAALAGFLSCERGWIEIETFFRDRGMSAGSAGQIADDLGIVKLGTAGMLPQRWQDYRRLLLECLDAFHLSHPDVAGVGTERLRLGMMPRIPAPVFAAVLDKLGAEGEIALDRAWVRRPSHVVRLSAEEERIWDTIKPSLNGQSRFCPPRVRDIARTTGIAETFIRRLFKLAARRGEVDEVVHDHFFLRVATGELAATARELAGASEQGKFNVIAFRDRIGGGRKVAIQNSRIFRQARLHHATRRLAPHQSTQSQCAVSGRAYGRDAFPGGASGLQIRVGPRDGP